MAGLYFTAAPGAVTVTSATAITYCQLVAASNHRVFVHQLDFGFNGITAADPPTLMQLLIQTSAGTMSSLTLVKWNAGDDETLQTTAQHTSTVAPTDSSVKWSTYVHEQTRGQIYFPKPLIIPGGTRMGLKLTPGTTTTNPSFSATLLCEE